MTSLLGIATMYYPEGGGAELSTHLHYKALVKRGWKVSVVAYTFNHRYSICEIIDGVAVYRIPSPVPYGIIHDYVAVGIDPLAIRLIEKLLGKSDIVHVAEHVYSAIPYVKALSRKPVVAHVHDYAPVCYNTYRYDYMKKERCSSCTYCGGFRGGCNLVSCILGKRITKLVYECGITRVAHFFAAPFEIPAAIYVSRRRRENLLQADIIIAVSNTMARDLRYLMPESGSRVITVYNPLYEVGSYVRPHKTGRVMLLYTGGAVYEKGIFHLLRAWKLLIKSNKDVKLCIANGQNSLCLRHAVRNHKLASTVNLLPKLANEEISRLMSRATAAVVPSLASEGLPYAAVEPMLGGRAVFASPTGGIPEILRHGYGGYFIDPLDPCGSASVMAKISDFDEMVKQGKYARNHIRRLLTYEKTTGRLEKTLTALV